ncbi:hypothetical protein CHUAL_005708 [Chamberlinius hualienensis]
MSTIAKEDRLNYWFRKWDNNDLLFHKLQPNDALVTNIDKLTLGREHLTFLIPLCGKSLDMAWLYRQGHSVIGIEVSELAITSFFRELELDYTKSQVPNGTLYYSGEGRIKIFQGDLFRFDVETIGKVDAVWDRGSLVAIYKDERIKYSELLKSYLKPGFRYLLQTVEYDDRNTSSPFFTPRSVPENEVRSLFNEFGIVEKLRAEDKTEEVIKGRVDEIWATEIMRCDYLITDKAI